MKKLKRKNGIIGGVCGGIADYFDIDPLIVRIGTVILGLMGFPLFIPYIILCLVIPSEF